MWHHFLSIGRDNTDIFLYQLIQLYWNNATNLQHLTSHRVGPQHRDRNVTTDYCNVTSSFAQGYTENRAVGDCETDTTRPTLLSICLPNADHFLPRDAMLPRYMPWPCVRPSVCLSVTSPSSVKTAKARITQPTQHSIAQRLAVLVVKL